MKKHNNIFIKISSTILICLYILSFGINKLNTYNSNNIEQEKVVGSKMGVSIFSRIPAESLEELLENANLVFEGTVITDGSSQNKQLEDKFISNYGKDKVFEYTTSSFEIKIEKMLFGKSDSETIILDQLGSANSDSGETKVKKGEKMLFILKKNNDGENTYSSVDLEDGLFRILSDNKAVSKYDNKDLIQLKTEIKSICDRKQ